MTKSIVVGVDESSGALAAAHYAAAIAQRRNVPLTLLHVFETPFHGCLPLPLVGDYAVADRQLREAAELSLEQMLKLVEASHPGLKVGSRLEFGGAAAILVKASGDSLATVLGSRGKGGFAGLMLGSVSAEVATHGHGPIMLVRPTTRPEGPVLVGFDGSEPSYAAVEFAAQEALRRDVPLVVANAYWEKPWGWHEQPAVDPVLTARCHAEQMIRDALELTAEQHPELKYDIRTIHSLNPAHSLIEESAHAGLTVVGSRGRGGFAGLLLGSVSRAVIHHAAGPVAVIHPSER